jgi:hypothetical protein
MNTQEKLRIQQPPFVYSAAFVLLTLAVWGCGKPSGQPTGPGNPSAGSTMINDVADPKASSDKSLSRADAQGGGHHDQAILAAKSAFAVAEQPAKRLHRPYIRKHVRAEVYSRAPRAPDGRPIDPNTLQPIDGTPDFGHKAGHEFWREKAKAEAEGLTQAQFNDRMNDPDLYQLEDPSSNRSHRFEKPRQVQLWRP